MPNVTKKYVVVKYLLKIEYTNVLKGFENMTHFNPMVITYRVSFKVRSFSHYLLPVFTAYSQWIIKSLHSNNEVFKVRRS